MIEVTRVRFIKRKQQGTFVGNSDIVINGCIALNYLSVHLADKGSDHKYRVVYPVIAKEGFEKAFAYPITSEVKKLIDEEVSAHIIANYDLI